MAASPRRGAVYLREGLRSPGSAESDLRSCDAASAPAGSSRAEKVWPCSIPTTLATVEDRAWRSGGCGSEKCKELRRMTYKRVFATGPTVAETRPADTRTRTSTHKPLEELCARKKRPPAQRRNRNSPSSGRQVRPLTTAPVACMCELALRVPAIAVTAAESSRQGRKALVAGFTPA
jgi:hypothetical protein